MTEAAPHPPPQLVSFWPRMQQLQARKLDSPRGKDVGPGLVHSTLCSTPKAYPLFVVLMETISHVAKASPDGLLQVERGSWEVPISPPCTLLWLRGGFLLGAGCCGLHAHCGGEGKGGEAGKGAFWQVGTGLSSRRHRVSSSVVSYLLGNWGCCSLAGGFRARAFLSALSVSGGFRS